MSQFKLKEKNFISVVIHVKENYNILKPFIQKIDNLLNKKFESFEIIIVNNSQKELLKDFIDITFNESSNGTISVVNLSWSHSIEDAMRAGIDLTIGDFIVEFDSVLKYFDDKLFIEVYNKCLEGFDAVSAEPRRKSNKTSKLFYKILNKLSHKNILLNTDTFRIVSRRMLNRSSEAKETFRYRKAHYLNSGLKTTKIRYDNDVIHLDNDFDIKEKVLLGSNILIYYSNIGVRIGMFLSISFFLFSVMVGFYAILSYIFKYNEIQEGWTTIMLFLSISFSGLFGVLTILSKYMEVLLKEIQVNKAYSYNSIERYK